MSTISQASIPFRSGQDGACVEVDLIRCGHSMSPPGWFFRQEAHGSWRQALGIGVPKDRWLESPIGAFLVRHPTAGVFLIDTGLSAEAATALSKDFGLINSRAFSSLQMRPEDATASRVLALGVEPRSIELIVMTHLHVDHTSGMRDFPAAGFLCSEEEWSATRGRGAVLRGYVSHHLPDPTRIQTISPGAWKPHGPFSRTVDLFGDGSVRLIATPGHTPGHLSVLVRLQETGEALLAGDAVYTLRSLHESLISWRTANDAQFEASLAELRAYATEKPQAPIVPTHDAETWRTVHRLS